MVISQTLTEAEQKMDKAVEVTREDFAAIRAGRAHPSMFSKLTADYYGTPTPLSNMATIGAPEARLLSVQPYDSTQIKAIEKAIQESDLGLTPSNDGKMIRLPMPQPNEERRKELVKLAHKYAETARVAVRHVRRDAMDVIKKLEKDHKISKDDHERFSTEIQKATDAGIAEIDHMLAGKEKEILTV